MPSYNVELFLKEALDSLLKQGVSDDEMQVIVIDDGSTDDTFYIAQQYALKYPNVFEVHTFKNGGLGAARNRGTRLADAEYITYFDSDDVIVENSYRKALDILSETHSDILIGGTKRFNSQKIWDSWIHSRAVFRDLRGVTFSEHPELVWDSTAWNKIYNLDFLRQNNLYTPEGILYEDMPMVVPALTLAKSIDVMADTMYLWRSRDFGAPSITQMSSNETKPIIDRLYAMTSILKSLKEYKASDVIVKAQMSKFLNFDIMVMYAKNKFDLFTDEQKGEIYVSLKNFLKLFSEEELKCANFQDLVYFERVLATNSQEEFETLTLNFLRGETNYKGYWQDNQYVLSSNLSELTKVATTDDFESVMRIEDVYFELDHLKISGYFFGKFSDMSHAEYIKNVQLSLLDGERQVLRPAIGNVVFQKASRITANFGYNATHFERDIPDFNYDYSAYTITIPLSELDDYDVKMHFELSAEIDGVTVSEIIKNPVSGKTPRPDTYLSSQNGLYSVTYDTSSWFLEIAVTKDVPTLKYDDSGKLLFEGDFDQVSLVSGRTTLALNLFENKLLIPTAIKKKLQEYDNGIRKTWQFTALSTTRAIQQKVYFSGDAVQYPNDTSLEMVYADSQKRAVLKVSWIYPLIQSLKVEDDLLKLTFDLQGWQKEASKVQILADPKLPDLLWDTKKLGESTYSLELPLTLDGFDEKEWLNFQVRLSFRDGYQTDEVLRWGPKHFDLKKEAVSAGNISWLFWEISNHEYGGFAIKRTADRICVDEVGGLEMFLEETYQEWLQLPILEDTIVWAAYWGKGNQLGGNPGALYRYVQEHYPDLKHVIVLENKIRSYPEFGDAEVISFGTKAYWYFLARAKYFVNDVNFEESGRQKREEQIEIQTMHGTPLKKMGFEVLDEWRDETYDAYLRRNRNWDYLVVPSDYVADLATKAYNISPKLLKTGYPRNDVLFKQYSASDLISLRETFELPKDKKIIAYLPTWHGRGKTDISRYLDVESFYKAIPDDTLVLLKSHPFEEWINLESKYADKFAYVPPKVTIEELYIISDAIITDYSSAMFDYVLLNKPMMFYAFDYEVYTEQRGLNFDLRHLTPGPFLKSQKGLEKWLGRIDVISNRFSKNIARFNQKFGQYDKGNACEQISRLMWGETDD